MSACRSCGAPIRWARTPAGKAMPLDAQPSPEGNVLVTPEVEAEEIDSDLRERAEAEIEKLDRRIEAIEDAAAIEACYEEAERENTDRAAAAMMGEVGRDVLDLYATETMALTYPISAEAAREEIARRQAAAPDPHARTETTEEEMDADEIAAVREEVAR